MAVSNKRIRSALTDGRIIIEPFRPSLLNTSSHDVCLGEYFYREQRSRLPGDVFNIYDPDHVAKVWGETQRAQKVGHGSLKNISPDDRVIMLPPGANILAHTEEFIGGRGDITTKMQARSSIGRSLITVCKCAGWGDVGYINRWTMEISNYSNQYTIPLVVGEPIAQIVFEDCLEAEGDYSDDGSYQQSADIETLIAEWSPQAMLPRTKRKNIR